MRISSRLLAHWFFAVSGSISSSVVWAAVAPSDLSGLPWPQILVGVALALWGGLTRTAERALEASKSARDDPPGDFDLRGDLVKDLIVSSGIGFLVFALGSWQEWGVWLLGSALWLAGYLGTRFLAGVGEAALAYVQRKVGSAP